MLNKKIGALFTALLMVASITVGCGNKEAEKADTKKSDVIIGLATDEGGVNDKSFNQSADEGIKKAQKEVGFEYIPIESTGKEDYEENLEALVDQGANLVFGVGFQMAEAVTAAAEKYPENNFAIVDSIVDLPNVKSVNFKEHEGSFLMGVIAGKMAGNGKVGFIGGRDFELINRFEVGFAAGVKSVNPKAAEDLISRKTVKYADSFGDVNKGYELGKALYDEGCTIVYHAAGGVGIGLFSAATELRKAGQDVWAIGVDKDQAAELASSEEGKELAGCILSSMIKRVDVATYTATKDVVEGKFEGGQTIVLGLVEDGVGIADTTKDNTPEEVIELVDTYKKAIVDGKFAVPSNFDELKSFEVPEI